MKQLQTQGDLGKQLQDVTKSIVREVITPLLCCMAAKRPLADGKSWSSTYSAMLDLGERSCSIMWLQATTQLCGYVHLTVLLNV